MKLGRNDPCWCGSGKKYKFCHLNRDKLARPTPAEIHESILGPLQAKICLHPAAGQDACARRIIDAHTIQKRGGLSKIARNGHVYALHANPFDRNFELKPKLIGINKASTFNGFCSKHDDSVFAPIEKQPFVPCAEHALLLGYRALCRELYGKRAVQVSLKNQKLLDRGRSIKEQRALQAFLSEFERNNDLVLRDLEYYKSQFDDAVITSDFSSVRYYIVEFNVTPEIQCSAGQFPLVDFEGHILQRARTDQILGMVAFSIIATDTGGAAVFAWLGDCRPVVRLVESIDRIPGGKVGNALIRYAFEFFENVFFSPDWWESLDEGDASALVARTRASIDPFVARHRDCLADDGRTYVSWPVLARHILV